MSGYDTRPDSRSGVPCASQPKLAAAGVGYDEWLRFAGPLMVLLTALGAVAVMVALAIGLT